MSDMTALSAIRAHLLKENLCPRVHFNLPPSAAYPLVLVEMEEAWPPPLESSIDTCFKFRVGLYSDSHGPIEVARLSEKVRSALEGLTLPLPDGGLAMVKFLACENGNMANSKSDAPLQAVNQYYNALVWSSPLPVITE